MNMSNHKEKQAMCENMCDKKYDMCILTSYNYDSCKDALNPRQIDNVPKRLFKNVVLANVNGLGTGQAHFFTENGEYILVPWSMIVWMLPAKITAPKKEVCSCISKTNPTEQTPFIKKDEYQTLQNIDNLIKTTKYFDAIKKNNKKPIIRKSSDFICCSNYDLEVFEQKILLYMLSKIKPEDTKFEIETITYDKICELFNVARCKDNNFFYDCVNKLLTKTVSFNDSNIQWFDTSNTETGWQKDNNEIKLKLNDELASCFLPARNKNDNFVEYNLDQIKFFRNKYSFKLYDLFTVCANDNLYNCILNVEKLRTFLGIPNDSCKNLNDFRKHILDVCLKDINKYTDMLVSYDIDDKEKITQLSFNIKIRVTEVNI